MTLFKSFMVACLLLSFHVMASVVTYPNNANAPVFVPGDNGKLIVNSPNEHGISYNRINNLTVNDRLLVIPNNYLPKNANTNTVKTVILHADTINLAGEIILAAKATTNIIIINTNANGQIICNSCEFSGFPRVTLATSTSSNTLNNTTSTIGNLNNTIGSSIVLNNLSAPDANSVEFHSQNISTSGSIQSVFYANKIGDEYVIADSGKVGVNAGFSFFTGQLTVSYHTHELITAQKSNSVNTFSGRIHGAGIAIVSAKPVRIASGSVLTTQSDIMATGHVGDEFFVPTGNIDIVLVSPQVANNKLTNQGSLFSDTGVNVSADEFHNTGMVSGNTAEFAVKALLSNNGHIELGTALQLSVNTLDNRGDMRANKISINSKDTFFNHLGGRILGNEVVIVTDYFINGSRRETIPLISKPNTLSLRTELVASANYGIFNSNNMSNSTSDLPDGSAKINANTLSIKAEQFENINPYVLLRKGKSWEGSVNLDYPKTKRVSITAENTLQLYASQYIVNSSAILGLNNSGEFNVNTPILQNERYRVDTEGYIFSRKFRNSQEQKHDSYGKEVEAHVNAISAIPTLYSYGDFNYSPLTSESGTKFSNTMGFVQIHGKSNFYSTEFSSIAMMASSFSDATISTNCIINSCNLVDFQDNYTQTTFTSFLDDVYGLSTEVLVKTIVQVEEYIQNTVDEYIEDYVNNARAEFIAAGGDVSMANPLFGELFFYNTQIDGPDERKVLVINVYQCSMIIGGEGFKEKSCVRDEHQKLVSVIAVEAAIDGIIPGTEQTDAQLIQQAKIYLANRNTTGIVHKNSTVNGEPKISRIDGFWKRVLSSYELDQNQQNETTIILHYTKKFYKNEALTQLVLGHEIDTSQKFTTSLLYSVFKNERPKVPANLNSSYNSNTGELTLNWDSVLIPNVTYEIDQSGLPSSPAAPTQTSRIYVKQSSATVTFRVRACVVHSGSKLCGGYSATQTKKLTFTGSTPPIGPPIKPPNCPTCQPHNPPIGPGQGEHY